MSHISRLEPPAADAAATAPPATTVGVAAAAGVCVTPPAIGTWLGAGER
jgi:hypothetical protein